jgi:hypothetical protein
MVQIKVVHLHERFKQIFVYVCMYLAPFLCVLYQIVHMHLFVSQCITSNYHVVGEQVKGC